MRKIIVAILLGLLLVTSAFADERQSGDMEFNVWGLSHHLSAAPEGRTFNEVNPGIGLRAYFNNINGIELFGDAELMTRNSTRGRLIQFGVGGQYPVFSSGGTDFLVGLVGGVMSYENTWTQRTYVSPGAYPFVGVRHNDASLTIGYIPEVSVGGTTTFATLFGYIGLRF